MSKKFKKNVFTYKDFLVYLSGAIDFDRDGGRKWRQDWTKRLIKIGFKKKQILSPCKKPLLYAPFKLDNEGEIITKYRKAKQWDKLCSTMSMIAHIDLRMQDGAQLVLANFPLDKQGNRVQTYGTMHELVVAKQQRKPIFIVWEGGKETCSAWLMWMAGHENIFASIDELIEHLRKIGQGKAAYNTKEWLLFNFSQNK